MTSIYYEQTPLSLSTVVLISGVIAGTFGTLEQPKAPSDQSLPISHQNIYHYDANRPSFSHIEESLNVSVAEHEFLETISRFYEHLMEKQEPLGQEFAQVLADNLWDLYEG
ncbi:MAG TPA: hypothetical protein DCS88_11405 [Alphaproteobacteria bacterium]|nr:hypothetical protein [Alphaproteobacteria bacterium]